MSKYVHLLIVGEGDQELRQLIEDGLAEIGQPCKATVLDEIEVSMLECLSDGEVPVVIKPM